MVPANTRRAGRFSPLLVALALALLAPVAGAPGQASAVEASAVVADAEDLTQLRQSSDYTDDDAEVLRLYRAFFLREPDIEGARYWIDLRRDGLSIIDISEYFSVSTEFGISYGTLDDAAFVAQVYRNVFGRDADDAGHAYWLGELTSGSLDRGGVVYWMTVNPEMVSSFPYAPIGAHMTSAEARQATLPVGACDLVTEDHRTLLDGRSVWTGPDGEYFRIAERAATFSEATYHLDADSNADVVFIVECVEDDGNLIDDGVVVWLSTRDPMVVDTVGNTAPGNSIAYHDVARWETVDDLQVLRIELLYWEPDTPLCCPLRFADWFWELVDGEFEYIRT